MTLLLNGKYTITSKQYKQGDIHTSSDGKISASCAGNNAKNFKSIRAAKLWITKTWAKLDYDESTITQVIP